MASDTLASPRFFALEVGRTWSRYDADASKVEPVSRGPAPRCTLCGDPIGMRTWLPPYRVDLELHGEGIGDLVKSSGYDFVVSERFGHAFQKEELTGLVGFHPVQVRRVRHMRRRPLPSETPHYLAVTACFGRGALDLVNSRIHYTKRPTCEECRDGDKDAVHGFTLEPGTWNGEDIFRPRGLQGTLVVSERFERFVAKHGFTNMRLTPTEEYVWNPLGLEPSPPVI